MTTLRASTPSPSDGDREVVGGMRVAAAAVVIGLAVLAVVLVAVGWVIAAIVGTP